MAIMDITFKHDIDVELIQHIGSDQMIAHAAWVSTRGMAGKMTDDPEKVPGLINYLMKHRHGTPFEAGGVTFRVHAPIFVWREWHRHRIGWSYNEESARYKQLDPVFYIPARDRPMLKIEGWKPGRPKFDLLDTLRPVDGLEFVDSANTLYDEIIGDMKDGYKDEYARYQRQLNRNLDPGLARDCLPVGIFSACWVTCNPRSLMHFLSLRTYDETAKAVSYPLYEIEVAARKVEAEFARLWPLTYQAFCQNGRAAP